MDISKFGTQYSGDYARPNLFVVNMDNGTIIYETSGEAIGALSSNVWIEGIGLGSVIAPSNQIGVFLQPLSDFSAGQDDWYPCLDSDGSVGSSNSGIYDFDSGSFTANGSVGNFLTTFTSILATFFIITSIALVAISRDEIRDVQSVIETVNEILAR